MKKQKKYQYWIIKTYNKKRKKILYRSRDYKLVRKAYVTLIQESKKVTIPKKYLNRGGLTPINVELLLITDNPQLKKIAYNNKTIINSTEEWFIIEARKYNEEDKFYSYPERKMIHYQDILNYLINVKEHCSIYLFFNKIIIDSPIKVYKAIVFKNRNEAIAVYNKLLQEDLKVIFLGKLNKQNRKILSKKIMNDVGIAKINLYNKKSIH